jgi:hypothetical protein
VSPKRRTLNQIRQAGIAALNEALGPVDAARFIGMFDHGSGDYTAQRFDLIGNPTVDELRKEIEESRAQRGRNPE